MPPATGYVGAELGVISASIASIAAASIHDRIDAGPAAVAALSAPSSQPEPMIEPSDTNMSP